MGLWAGHHPKPTIVDFSAWVKRVSLDGFTFHVYEGAVVTGLPDGGTYFGPFLRAAMQVPIDKIRGSNFNAIPGDLFEVAGCKPLSEIDTEEKFFRLCTFIACELAAHEMQEQLEVDGAQFYFPHRQGDLYGITSNDGFPLASSLVFP
jgi:hypothetical protein